MTHRPKVSHWLEKRTSWEIGGGTSFQDLTRRCATLSEHLRTTLLHREKGSEGRMRDPSLLPQLIK